jgi:hypothetical protein
VLATAVLATAVLATAVLATDVVLASALTRIEVLGAAAATVTEVLVVASSSTVVETAVLLLDELEDELDDELEDELESSACSISTESASPESWLAAANPAAPSANPATAAATTAIRFPIRPFANIPTSRCVRVLQSTRRTPPQGWVGQSMRSVTWPFSKRISIRESISPRKRTRMRVALLSSISDVSPAAAFTASSDRAVPFQLTVIEPPAEE